MDVAAWLQDLGLERYVPAFRENDIDAEVLPKLTAEDLISIGVTSVGDRRKLLAAIASLGAAEPFAGTGRAAPRDARTLADAERRQLTVMFCDLVGSTELSARLDPEDLREVIAAYHFAVADVVRNLDGFVAKYMGDGVLVYFGYPQAHEDDTERAVRAGLGVIDAVRRLNVKSVELQARVGIATGLVVVGDLIGEGSAQEQSVVGETPNPAARLQALARPGAVVIAAATRRLIGDLFEYRDLGSIDVKGITTPVPAWQVLRPSAVASRFEALRGSARTLLVGRDEEVNLLLRRWARAKAGDGQVVLISGEPGIGKSRLTAALTERLHTEPHLRLRYFCSPYHQDSALFPFIDQLSRASGFAHEDPSAAKLGKLEVLLSGAAPAEEDVALIADLMSLPASERRPLPSLSAQRKKEKTLEALIRQLEGLAHRQPVVMVFEDAHWIDPTSRELIDLTVERVGSLPVLLLMTFRPEFQPSWTGQPQVSMLRLNRLDRRDRTALVTQIAGVEALPDEVIAQIVDRTDGVPLFVEELTKSVLEGGVSLVGIPATLHDSLMARLDRSASVRVVAQIGAVIGREFSYRLLHALSRVPEDELQAALARLVDSELVFQRGLPPDAVYSFKHVLVQDAAHGSLLRTTRQQLHAEIAQALETQSPELVETEPELFAQHYEEAGQFEKAIAYWHLAGQRSAKKSAVVEAVAQLQRGLRLINTLPDNLERAQLELNLQVTLGTALYSAKGSSHPDTVEAHKRAHEVVRRTGSAGTQLEFAILLDTWMATLAGGDATATFEQARRLLEIARSRQTSAMLVVAHRAFGSALVMNGDYRAGVPYLEKAAALFNPAEQRREEFQSAQDVGVTVFTHLSWGVWHHGYPDRAIQTAYNALHLAESSVASVVSFAEMWACWTMLFSRRLAEAGDLADALVARANEHRMPMWSGFGLPLRGAVLLRRGDGTGAVESIREGLSVLAAIGARYFEPFYLALLGEALASAGEIDEALEVLDKALAHAEASGQKGNNAELHRLRGELLTHRPEPDLIECEACFRDALATAREQGTRGFELRAAVSLGRLRRDQSHHAEARDLAAPVYGWFTEGFDTQDLKEAKTLLDELA
jgi:class 3 adenylate cyclase/predicted ATPase